MNCCKDRFFERLDSREAEEAKKNRLYLTVGISVFSGLMLLSVLSIFLWKSCRVDLSRRI